MANLKSNGTKTTRSKASSTTGQKKTSKTSSRTASVKTQENLEKNLEKLASPKQTRKTGKTSGTTPKAKAKTSSNTSSPQKTTAPGTRKKTTSRKKIEIVPKNSRKQELFPHKAFPYRLEIKAQKRVCHFSCHEHALKEIARGKLQPKEYTYQVYPKYL